MSLSKIKLFKKNYLQNNENTIFGLLSQGDDDDIISSVDCRYILVLDTSNSMNIKADGDKSRKDQLIEALKKLVNSAVLNDKKLSIYSFSDESELRLDETLVSNESKGNITKVIKDLKKTLGRKTYLYKPLEDIYDSVFDSDEYFYHVILFTDGDDHDSEKTMKIVQKLRNDKNITVSFVAFGDEYKMDVMTDLANSGRGSFYHLSDISAFYKEIRNDIKIASKRKIAKTTLKYVSSQKMDSKGLFSIDSIFKVGESGIIKLDNDKGNKYLLGGLSVDEQIFFKIDQKAIETEGEYSGGKFIVSTGNKADDVINEFDINIDIVEKVIPEMPDPEISDVLRKIRMYDISLEVEKLQIEGKHKEAEAKLKSAMPIAQQLGIDEDVTVILKNKDRAGRLNLNMTRKLVSDSKTKGLRKRRG